MPHSQYYFKILRQPSLAPILKRLYIPERGPVSNAPPLKIKSNATQNVVESAVGIPAAYPLVQPMKAALYFDTADGFGEWRIIISTRADADLRQIRKKNSKLFAIIIEKIKLVLGVP